MRTAFTREERRTQTRSELLDAAEQLFSEQGFHATSVDQVADEAGYTKGAVYSNFADKDDILRNFGRPAETSAVGYHDYEVWSYRYKEAGVWNSMMHVHFDQQGVVRQMLNGPDPMYDDRFRHR